MRRRQVLAWPLGTALTLAGCASQRYRAAATVVPFSAAAAMGAPPAGWEPYVLRRDLARTDYRTVDRDGMRVLHASARGGSSGLRQVLRADALVTPRLRWSWRVDALPADFQACSEVDDAAARVVLGFDGDHTTLPAKDRALFELVELVSGYRLPYATLMYVWDASLPVGTVVRYRRTDRVRYLVVESGRHACGKWVHYDRNVLSDFRMAFGEDAGAINSIGVLTDSDDTHAEVDAWYGDIGLGT